MKINLKRAVNEFQEVSFYQPLFETIVNAIEANASLIEISLDINEQKLLDGSFERKINGFSILDNGDGFTDDNISSFSTFYSEMKKKLGCKGIGRLSWLKVFNLININSYTGTNNVFFDFNFNFNDVSTIQKEHSTKEKYTTIKFSLPQDNYIKKSIFTTLDDIKGIILRELTVKLYLLYRAGKEVIIKIKYDKDEIHIKKESLPNLREETFSIVGNNSIEYNFTLFYDFLNNNPVVHEHYVCADERKVKSISEDIIPHKFPESKSSYFLLCSDYIDKQVQQERTEFYPDFTNSRESMTSPVKLEEILEVLKTVCYKIVVSEFPEIKKENQDIIERCSKEYPHLIQYFNSSTNQLLSEKALIKNAKLQFDNDKENIRKNFYKLLKSKKIDEKAFNEQAQKISSIASIELAEYIFYREQILDAISKTYDASKDDSEYPEKFLHNLLIPMGTTLTEESSEYDSNLWILDDKFMGFKRAFSDKKISMINKELIDKYSELGSNYEPDVAVFYTDYSGKLDLIVIEIKRAGEKAINKLNAVPELNRNIGNIVKNYNDIRRVYGYVVMHIDENTANDLTMQGNMLPLFTKNGEPCFYQHNANIKDIEGNPIDTHVYLLSLKTIEADARARNKTFLSILTKNS